MVHRLVYTDDNSNQQVIGRLSSSETGSVFNKARRKIQDKNYSKLNIWGDSTLYGNLPVSTSNFESGNVDTRTEPYVLWQENTGTQASPNWVNRFRGFIDSQGVITDNGDVKFTVFSMEKYLGQQKVSLIADKEIISSDTSTNEIVVNGDYTTTLDVGDSVTIDSTGYTVDAISYDSNNDETTVTLDSLTVDVTEGLLEYDNLVNTDIVTVLQEMIPAGYTVDFPGDVTIPSVDRYSLNTKRAVGFRDLTRDYGWNLVWRPETDANGDWIIRFEPDGYGGTVDDIYSSASATYTNNIPDQTLGRFNEWSKERTKDIINSAQVIGSDSDGNTILSDVKQDSSSINDYGEKFERKQVGYLESKSEADSLAQDIVDNNSTPVEGGRVDASPRYRSIVANDSFNLRDASRNIDAVYTCNVQKDFYPEDKTYLFFNFEKDTEKRAAEKENLRSERDQIIGNTTQDVGSQDFTGDTEDVTDSYDDFGNDDHPHGNNDSTSEVDFLQFSEVLQATSNTVSLNDNESFSVSGSVIYSGNAYQISYLLETDAGYGAEFIVEITSGTSEKQSFVTKTNDSGEIKSQFSGLDNISNENVEFRFVNKSGGTVSATPFLTIAGEQVHDHDVPISDTNNNTTGGNNNTNSNDSTAGDTTSLNASGSTDTKNIKVAQEEKTDR